jgi:hypothetical protein
LAEKRFRGKSTTGSLAVNCHNNHSASTSAIATRNARPVIIPLKIIAD